MTVTGWPAMAVVGPVTLLAARSVEFVNVLTSWRLVGVSDCVKLVPRPVTVENVPDSLPKFITPKLWPPAGVKPPTRARLNVPARVAEPVIFVLPYWPLAGVPPICSLKVVPDVSLKLPLTASVLPEPTVNVPLLAKAPVVLRFAPLLRVKLPLFEAKPEMAGTVAPAPSSTIVAALLVIETPLGTFSFEPFITFHVPPVSVAAGKLRERGRADRQCA